MVAHSKLWYLQRFKFADGLGEAQRQLLADTARILEVKRGQRIYLPGDPSDEIFLVKAGVVKLASPGPDSRELILAFLYPGDIFGETAVVDESPRDHYAEVQEDALVCALNKQVVLRLARESPDLGFRITKLMGSRVKELRVRLEQLLGKSAAARLAYALVDLAEKHGVPDADGAVIPFKLNQSDLAGLVGLTRETVNVMLHEFRQRGLVEVHRQSIRLLDVQGLREIRE